MVCKHMWTVVLSLLLILIFPPKLVGTFNSSYNMEYILTKTPLIRDLKTSLSVPPRPSLAHPDFELLIDWFKVKANLKPSGEKKALSHCQESSMRTVLEKPFGMLVLIKVFFLRTFSICVGLNLSWHNAGSLQKCSVAKRHWSVALDITCCSPGPCKSSESFE